MARPARLYQPQGSTLQARLAGTPLASFRRRAAAILIDGSLVGLVLLLIGSTPTVAGTGRVQLSFELGGLLAVVVAVLYFGLATYFGRGRTIGKRLCGIRVVSLVHERLSLWHCVERTLGYSASSLEGGFGFLQYFKHVNAQTVHDRIAETIVVKEPPSGPTRAT